ncbi:hypothetical protein ACEWY4_000050 [Coilia grayii]|uniref:Reverse transcriptase domain-containing protein n=1 Tax=Coilia grayii TaxID=363190 RepID=A0ABD1KVL4_9TELE
MERFQIPPPPKFDFTRPEEWPKWIKRFERFRIASGLELQAEENQSVVPELKCNLLGRPAIQALGLVARVDTVALGSTGRGKEQFPKIFKGLGKMEGQYKIELRADAKLFPISTPQPPEHYQKRMSRILERLDAVLCQMDNVLVYGDTQAQHDARLFGAGETAGGSAFNIIQPLLLRDKLLRMGVESGLVTWITDYLTERPQFVRLGDLTSQAVVSSIGAPQGTVLSPVLFTLYTTDFSYNSETCHMQKFSDDTAIGNSTRQRAAQLNKRHRAQQLTTLTPGDHVWVKDTKEKGTVISQANTPRSYVIDSPRGVLRHNRNHLIIAPVLPAEQIVSPEPDLPTDQPPSPARAEQGPAQLSSPVTQAVL